MYKKRRVRLALILVLCATFLFGGPVQPISVYANLDVEGILGTGESEALSEESSDKASEAESAQESSAKATAQTTGNARNKYQGQINDINDKLKNLDVEKKEIQKSINEAKTAKEKELANKNYIDQQIGVTKSEISLLMERIEVLEQQIADKEEDISQKQADIDHSYAQFKTRLRALQISDNGTQLGLILGASDFADFLSKTEIVSRIAEHDQELMRKLTGQRGELEQAKAELELSRQDVEKDREETEQKKQTLNVQLNAAAVAVYNLEQMEKEYLADLAKNQAETKAMEKELNSIYERIKWDENPYVGGEMAWPAPGFYKISSPYGSRFGGRDFHTGMDIAGTGIYGSSIVAANSGTVKFVNTSYTVGRGYGIYLIVDHGGTYSTLYAHCSSIVVKVGDKVEKGQKIAEVGSTGWSTGPHLHFEVRKNGVHTNPLPYVQGK